MEKTVDFGASDAPINKKELERAGGSEHVVQIPVIAGAVVPGYKLPGLQKEVRLDGPALANIFLGKITRWNDPAIVALNPDGNMPDLAITPVHRTDGSGTTFIFSSYLATQSDEFKEKVGASKQVGWPGGGAGKGNEGVAQVVESTPGAIGYIELAYANQNKISFALMKNHDGEFVKASPESTSAAGEGALKTMNKNLAASLWDQPGKGVYPIAGFTYVMVYSDLSFLKDESRGRALADFLLWATTDGQALAGKLDYAPLSAGVQAKVAEEIGRLSWSGSPIKTASK